MTKKTVPKKMNSSVPTASQPPVKLPLVPEFKSGELGKYARDRASILNYAELKRLMMQNVGKTQSKTFTQYTKEKIQSYILNPLSNLDNIRDVSQFVYRVSNLYKKVIDYFAGMLVYSYNVVFQSKDWSKNISSKDFLKNYQTVLQRLNNINMSHEMGTIIATALRDGIYVGFAYDDEETFFLQALDPKYCKVASITSAGTYIIKFNAAYFDSGTNKEFLYGVNNDGEGIWDDVFISGYETYKNDGRDFQWFELPPEKTIAVVAGDDPLIPLPYFMAVLPDILDLIDYGNLIRQKTELENYVLLVSKIPLISSTKDVDDFAVSMEYIQMMQGLIDEAVPSLVGTAYSPCELTPVRFDRNDQNETDIMAKATRAVYDNLGVSQVVFNNNGTTTSAITASEIGDAVFAYRLLSKLEANIQRYVTLNISDEFLFYFHRVTYFNLNEYSGSLKDKATLGLPKKLDWMTCDGTTPYRAMNQIYMENALNLVELLIPLDSSYTQSGKSEGGAPVKDVTELTDEGEKSKDKEKNKE